MLSLLAMSACATGGYQIVQGAKAPTPSVGAGVVLYGVEGEGNPPPGCRMLGTVRAWSFGEKTFPYDQLRAAAGRHRERPVCARAGAACAPPAAAGRASSIRNCGTRVILAPVSPSSVGADIPAIVLQRR